MSFIYDYRHETAMKAFAKRIRRRTSRLVWAGILFFTAALILSAVTGCAATPKGCAGNHPPVAVIKVTPA
jgi:hypothetical protein